MTSAFATPADTRLEAVILDYNGVIGRQPTPQMWQNLAHLAGWPTDQTADFERAFWAQRALYDAGEITTHTFWNGLLGDGWKASPRSALLEALRRTDTDMWTQTDPDVIDVLRAARAASKTPMVLLSNAPSPLAQALDDTPWRRTLMARAIYSARIGINKPAPGAYRAALEAAGNPDPRRTLFVDDRLDNCNAAAELGLRTLHFQGDVNELAHHLMLGPLRPAVGPARVPAGLTTP
ncbi:HAD-IA family hydrolase [Streptomyces sp. NPDC047009]|uniref:HAD-IA family hydrolase n=1 Tax=Streptomyces sp. NPDC047009 TaxID=3154496 RepID=UPI0033C9A40B